MTLYRHELSMRTRLRDAALVEYEDLVRLWAIVMVVRPFFTLPRAS